jgi:hypothetical protein
MSQTMLAPDRSLTITLEAQHWNAVMTALQEAPLPYRMTAPAIAALSRQFNALAENHTPLVKQAAPVANGAARDMAAD